jgi:hypothetical protein
MLLGAALIVFPLYGLAGRLSGGRYPLPLAALGALVPGILLMSPEFDQVNATASAVLFYLALRGLEVERRNMLWGLTGGILYGFAIYGSYGLWVLALPVAAMVLNKLFEGLGIDRVSGQANRSKRVLSFAFIFCVTSAGVWLGLWFIGQLNVPEVLRFVRANLQGFDEARASASWFLLNLTDFAQLAGIPLILTIFATIYRPVRQDGAESVHSMRRLNWANRWSMGVSFYGVLFGALILAVDAMGVVRGESGRVWMFMVPLGLMAVYHGVGRGLLGTRALAMLLVCQFIVCVVIAGRWMMP